jgi:potassium-transporting ATPase KdpC subunit
MISLLRPMFVLFGVLTLVTGFVYPAVVAGIGAAAFPRQVSGSLIEREGKVVGSSLISQSFQEPKYFWGRLSATSPMPNNAAASTGSNFGPSNPALLDAAKARIAALQAADPGSQTRIPIDLVTASGSGLDPDISPAAAMYQVPRVARERGLDAATVRGIVRAHVQPRQWGLFGEPRVNVLTLNLALDRAQTSGAAAASDRAQVTDRAPTSRGAAAMDRTQTLDQAQGSVGVLASDRARATDRAQ